MTRTVGDCALLLSAIARFDRRDPYCLPDDPRDWTAGLSQGVAGLRVAVLTEPGFDAPVDRDGVAAVEEAAALLADAGATVEQTSVALPDSRHIFGRLWGVALAKLVSTVLESQRGLLDAGLLEVAAAEGAMLAVDFLDAEAMRLRAAHTMADLHRRFDLVLTPTVANGAPVADAPTVDPIRKLWTEWAPWTFLYNLTRQPAITVPMPRGADGMPRSVQFAAALYRDDLVLRAAWAIEQAAPFAMARLD
jgi:aspartyl-tRNA(Asn)/glutamyl-tRNA(Gln) amidotransferase subunit A